MFPSYKVDGREFKTFLGMGKYLVKKHGANSHTGIAMGSRTFHILQDRAIVATYESEKPEIGKMVLAVKEL